jgi:aldose 1-epimerase
VIDVLTLENDAWQVGLLPATGGSVAFGRIADPAAETGWVDLFRPTDPADYGMVDKTASYVLAPWSNRIRSGLLRFAGGQYQLTRSFHDGTAIHGAARAYPWRVVEADGTRVVLGFDSADNYGVNFPWQFTVEVTYALDGPRFATSTRVTNTDAEPFPAGFGHHPYFERGLRGMVDEVRLEIPCKQQFELTHNMASAPAVPITESLDFTVARPLGSRFIDENLTGRIPGMPTRLIYPLSDHCVSLYADDIYQNVVVYVPQEGTTHYAVEPVTNANDGFGMLEDGIEGSGVVVLQPGESTSGTYYLEVE